jgi:NarL family two-component system response regulator YdfI
VIRVLVCAGTPAELAELAAFVREAASLQLIGSSLGRGVLGEMIAGALPDVVLEHWARDDSEQTDSSEFSNPLVVRVLLVEEADFAAAFAAIRSNESIRALLPAWASDREIRVAIETVAEGLVVLHPEIVGRLSTIGAPRPRGSHYADQALSPRETEILNLLSAGLGNKEIASHLKISEHTVKFHVTSIFNKLNVSSRAEAVAIGARRGLIIL